MFYKILWFSGATGRKGKASGADPTNRLPVAKKLIAAPGDLADPWQFAGPAAQSEPSRRHATGKPI
jgi:hypothetical protein